MDFFRIEKGVGPGHLLSFCLFSLYAEYTMWNTGLEELQAGFKIGGRNINNLRYADDTTLMAESEEQLKNLLMKLKEESEKASLKLNIKNNNNNNKFTAFSPITSQQIEVENMEVVTDFLFLGFKISADGDWSHEIRRWVLLGRKAMTNRHHSSDKGLYSQNYGLPSGDVQL